MSVLGALVLGLSPASAGTVYDDGSPEFDGEISNSILADSVSAYDVARSISEYDLSRAVEELGGSEPEEEDVIVLESDILFAAMEWELPGNAGAQIAVLVEDVPEGATVDVHGHTDSNPVPQEYDFDNQELSENRAQAVADVLEGERPDLELNVEGFGEDEPAATEDPEDPSTFAANRRVEIRYG